MSVGSKYGNLRRLFGLIFMAYGIGLLAVRTMIQPAAVPSAQTAIVQTQSAPAPQQRSERQPQSRKMNQMKTIAQASQRPSGAVASGSNLSEAQSNSGPRGIDLQINQGEPENYQSVLFHFLNISGEKQAWVAVGSWAHLPLVIPDVTVNINKEFYDQQLGNARVWLIGFQRENECKTPIEIAVLPSTRQSIQFTITKSDHDRCLNGS